MTQEIENITAEQAFKSNANFEKYLEFNPPEVMTSTLDEFNSMGADLHVIRYELTQKIESLSGALNQIARKESPTPSFIIWIFANEKEEVMELTRYIKQSESLGIFVFKASLNGDKMDVKCLLKPELKQKKKAVRNDNAPAKLLQKAYWDKYFEICDCFYNNCNDRRRGRRRGDLRRCHDGRDLRTGVLVGRDRLMRHQQREAGTASQTNHQIQNRLFHTLNSS